MSKATTSETSIKEKVYNLYVELQEAKKDKQVAAKTHSENVKRIEAELKELLDEEEEDVKNSQKVGE